MVRTLGFLVGTAVVLGGVLYAVVNREIILSRTPGAVQQTRILAPTPGPGQGRQERAALASAPHSASAKAQAGENREGERTRPGATETRAEVDRARASPTPDPAQAPGQSQADTSNPPQANTAGEVSIPSQPRPLEASKPAQGSTPASDSLGTHRQDNSLSAPAPGDPDLPLGSSGPEATQAAGNLPPGAPGNEASTVRWQAFWGPFNTLASARGFAENVTRRTSIEIRPIESDPGRYMVAFPYETQTDRDALKALIEERTGLEIRLR